MRVVIYTFSGTGNTFLTADFIAMSLSDSGVDIGQIRIEDVFLKGTIPVTDGVDHILIGYPIHAFNAPKIVVDFAKMLPSGNGKQVSIFKTSGEPFFFNNSSSHPLIKVMKSKGYKFMTETHLLMPYNVMFRYPDALVKQMYLLMQDMVGKFTEDVLNGTGEMISYTMFNRIFSFIFRIQWPGARFNGRFYSCNHKKCTLCLKCVKNCPSNNIRVQNKKIRFDGKCMMCMRCVQNCPHDAINIGILRWWAVRGIYNYNQLMAEDSIPSDYINENTKGYFRLFKRFFKKHQY